MEIFYDILNELQKESSFGEVKPTRIQQTCNMSYDKFTKNLHELENRRLVASCETCLTSAPLCITDRGIQFLEDYGKINNFLKKMKLDYLDNRELENEI